MNSKKGSTLLALCLLAVPALPEIVNERPSPVRYGAMRRSTAVKVRKVEAAPVAPVDVTAAAGPAASATHATTAPAARPLRGPDSEKGSACFYNPAPGTEAVATRIPSAAHRSYPIGSLVRVTQLTTGKSTIVKITDRMGLTGDRIISLSRTAAEQLSFVNAGTTQVQVDLLGAGDMAN